ncbi:hypothetical protein Chor_012310 [Crotalus horridus]
MLPDKSRVTKKKTTVRKKTVNPEFNEKLEWDLSLEEAQRRKLEAYVKNSVSFMSRGEPIGKLHIDLSQKDLTQDAGGHDVKKEVSESKDDSCSRFIEGHPFRKYVSLTMPRQPFFVFEPAAEDAGGRKGLPCQVGKDENIELR